MAWEHTQSQRSMVDQQAYFELALGRGCPYCEIPLYDEVRNGRTICSDEWSQKTEVNVGHVCTACGWWIVYRRHDHVIETGGIIDYFGTWGTLYSFSTSDVSTPIEVLRVELLRKYGSRFTIAPRHFEEIVGGVFEDFGYRVRVTSYSGDKGIDVVVLDHDEGETIGVQVKRYRGKIEADQIREFVGSLFLAGHTRGVYVTTSDFSRGAKTASIESCKLGLPVELWNSEEFYAALSIAQESSILSIPNERKPWVNLLREKATLPLIRHTSYS